MKWLLGLVAALVIAPPAHASIWVVDVTYGGAPQRWASLVPPPKGNVTVHRAWCPWVRREGCATSERPGEIWLAPETPGWRQELFHELGHLFDYQQNDAFRSAVMVALGLRGEWRNPPNSPHEKFAEAYRLCAAAPWLPASGSVGYLYAPTKRQHRRVCKLIRAASPS